MTGQLIKKTSVSPDSSDMGIIKEILAGKKDLFEKLIRKYNSRLFKIGMAILNNDSDTEDCMQISFIKSYENLSQFESRSSFGTWLVRIMINESLLQLKRNKRVVSMDENNLNEAATSSNINSADSKSPSEILVSKELAQALEESLACIPEKYRIVFVLREIEDMSVAETTEVLNISEANVKVRLNRAKSMLRDRLNSYYKNDNVYHFHLSRCDRMVSRVFEMLS